MLNLLIAENNLNIIKRLINSIVYNIPNIRLVKITGSESETINILNNNQIDIAILDYRILRFDIDKFYNKLSNDAKEKYKNSIIINFPAKNIAKNFNRYEIIANNIFYNSSVDEIIFKLHQVIKNKDDNKKMQKILRELEYIHYSIEHKGTQYISSVILYIFNNKHLHINNLQKQVYPIIAPQYGQSINTFRCDITRATTCMYYECDSKTLKSYFGILDDEKPTVKEVVFTILDKIN